MPGAAIPCYPEPSWEVSNPELPMINPSFTKSCLENPALENKMLACLLSAHLKFTKVSSPVFSVIKQVRLFLNPV